MALETKETIKRGEAHEGNGIVYVGQRALHFIFIHTICTPDNSGRHSFRSYHNIPSRQNLNPLQ